MENYMNISSDDALHLQESARKFLSLRPSGASPNPSRSQITNGNGGKPPISRGGPNSSFSTLQKGLQLDSSLNQSTGSDGDPLARSHAANLARSGASHPAASTPGHPQLTSSMLRGSASHTGPNDLTSLWRWQAGMGSTPLAASKSSIDARQAPSLGYLVPARTASASRSPRYPAALGSPMAKSRQVDEAVERQLAVKALREEQRMAARAYAERAGTMKRRNPPPQSPALREDQQQQGAAYRSRGPFTQASVSKPRGAEAYPPPLSTSIHYPSAPSYGVAPSLTIAESRPWEVDSMTYHSILEGPNPHTFQQHQQQPSGFPLGASANATPFGSQVAHIGEPWNQHSDVPQVSSGGSSRTAAPPGSSPSRDSSAVISGLQEEVRVMREQLAGLLASTAAAGSNNNNQQHMQAVVSLPGGPSMSLNLEPSLRIYDDWDPMDSKAYTLPPTHLPAPQHVHTTMLPPPPATLFSTIAPPTVPSLPAITLTTSSGGLPSELGAYASIPQQPISLISPPTSATAAVPTAAPTDTPSIAPQEKVEISSSSSSNNKQSAKVSGGESVVIPSPPPTSTKDDELDALVSVISRALFDRGDPFSLASAMSAKEAAAASAANSTSSLPGPPIHNPTRNPVVVSATLLVGGEELGDLAAAAANETTRSLRLSQAQEFSATIRAEAAEAVAEAESAAKRSESAGLNAAAAESAPRLSPEGLYMQLIDALGALEAAEEGASALTVLQSSHVEAAAQRSAITMALQWSQQAEAAALAAQLAEAGEVTRKEASAGLEAVQREMEKVYAAQAAEQGAIVAALARELSQEKFRAEGKDGAAGPARGGYKAAVQSDTKTGKAVTYTENDGTEDSYGSESFTSYSDGFENSREGGSTAPSVAPIHSIPQFGDAILEAIPEDNLATSGFSQKQSARNIGQKDIVEDFVGEVVLEDESNAYDESIHEEEHLNSSSIPNTMAALPQQQQQKEARQQRKGDAKKRLTSQNAFSEVSMSSQDTLSLLDGGDEEKEGEISSSLSSFALDLKARLHREEALLSTRMQALKASVAAEMKLLQQQRKIAEGVGGAKEVDDAQRRLSIRLKAGQAVLARSAAEMRARYYHELLAFHSDVSRITALQKAGRSGDAGVIAKALSAGGEGGLVGSRREAGYSDTPIIISQDLLLPPTLPLASSGGLGGNDGSPEEADLLQQLHLSSSSPTDSINIGASSMKLLESLIRGIIISSANAAVATTNSSSASSSTTPSLRSQSLSSLEGRVPPVTATMIETTMPINGKSLSSTLKGFQSAATGPPTLAGGDSSGRILPTTAFLEATRSSSPSTSHAFLSRPVQTPPQSQSPTQSEYSDDFDDRGALSPQPRTHDALSSSSADVGDDIVEEEEWTESSAELPSPSKKKVQSPISQETQLGGGATLKDKQKGGVDIDKLLSELEEEDTNKATPRTPTTSTAAAAAASAHAPGHTLPLIASVGPVLQGSLHSSHSGLRIFPVSMMATLSSTTPNDPPSILSAVSSALASTGMVELTKSSNGSVSSTFTRTTIVDSVSNALAESMLEEAVQRAVGKGEKGEAAVLDVATVSGGAPLTAAYAQPPPTLPSTSLAHFSHHPPHGRGDTLGGSTTNHLLRPSPLVGREMDHTKETLERPLSPSAGGGLSNAPSDSHHHTTTPPGSSSSTFPVSRSTNPTSSPPSSIFGAVSAGSPISPLYGKDDVYLSPPVSLSSSSNAAFRVAGSPLPISPGSSTSQWLPSSTAGGSGFEDEEELYDFSPPNSLTQGGFSLSMIASGPGVLSGEGATTHGPGTGGGYPGEDLAGGRKALEVPPFTPVSFGPSSGIPLPLANSVMLPSIPQRTLSQLWAEEALSYLDEIFSAAGDDALIEAIIGGAREGGGGGGGGGGGADTELTQTRSPNLPQLPVSLYLALEHARERQTASLDTEESIASMKPNPFQQQPRPPNPSQQHTTSEVEALQIRHKLVFDIINEELSQFRVGNSMAIHQLRAAKNITLGEVQEGEGAASSSLAKLAVLQTTLLATLKNNLRGTLKSIARNVEPRGGLESKVSVMAKAKALARVDINSQGDDLDDLHEEEALIASLIAENLALELQEEALNTIGENHITI